MKAIEINSVLDDKQNAEIRQILQNGCHIFSVTYCIKILIKVNQIYTVSFNMPVLCSIVIPQYINYTVCSLHCQKCPAFFCLCCVIRTFLGGSRHYMVKKMFPIFFNYFNIVYFFKKLWGFLFELIDFVLEESAVGERTVTFVPFQFLEIGTKHARRCREPTMTS